MLLPLTLSLVVIFMDRVRFLDYGKGGGSKGWRGSRHGATSRQDLVEVGINRGSLSDTFQDQRHLLLDAIAPYADTVLQATVSILVT